MAPGAPDAAGPEPADASPAPDAIRSPNIWDDPDLYEQENLGVDPDGAIDAAIARIVGRPLAGLDVVDVGCGAGFHLPRYAAAGARTVTGVEPHPPLVDRARARCAALPGVRVLAAGAQDVPVPDDSFDVHVSRWAYFFGAGVEPGLAELARVMRPGGVSVVVDNDATRSTFGSWFADAYPTYDAVAVERFWARRGWVRERVDMRWAFPTRELFERVVRLELPPDAADRALARHAGTGVDYAVNLWHHRW